MPGRVDTPIYDDLMRFKPEEITPNGWATKAGVSRTVWSDMRRHGNPSRRTLQKLLNAVGSSLAEFEALRISDAPASPSAAGSGFSDHRSSTWGAARLPPLPLVATTMAGDWGNSAEAIELTELRPGDIVDKVPRPASLTEDPSAYGLTIVGDSMWPRFRPGRRVAVSSKAPVAIGDDVVVKLRDIAESGAIPVLIKELVRKSGDSVELRQFNPDVTFRVDNADILSIEKVIGELI